MNEANGARSTRARAHRHTISKQSASERQAINGESIAYLQGAPEHGTRTYAYKLKRSEHDTGAYIGILVLFSHQRGCNRWSHGHSAPTKRLTPYPQHAIVPTERTHADMAPTTYKLRVASEELECWKIAAGKSGVKLAEWMRRELNDVSSVRIEGLSVESGDGQPVRAPNPVPMGERSARAPDRPAEPAVPASEATTPPAHGSEKRARPRSKSTIRRIEDVAHETSRKNIPDMSKAAVASSLLDGLCAHDYDVRKCPFTWCQNYKYKDVK